MRLVYLQLTIFALLISGCARMDAFFLYDSVRSANKYFDDANYGVAAAKYRIILDKYPESPKKEWMTIQLGRCFYNDRVQSLHDAQAVYRDYLEQYPDGIYRKDAQRELDRINTVRANREGIIVANLSQVSGNVHDIQEAIKDNPYDAELHLRLGNALWDLGRYDEACQAYLEGQEIDARLKEHELVRNRLEVNQWGEIIPLSPDNQREQEKDNTPIVLFDINEYKSRLLNDSGNGASSQVYYNVIGKVRNQSSHKIRGVIVEVSFFNPVGKLIDVKKDLVDDIPPGSVRVFSVRADNNDNVYNIARYECHAYEE